MCGRYTLSASPKDIQGAFVITEHGLIAWKPSYNIAPTQDVPVVRAAEKGREAAMLRWGLVPHWADGPDIGNRLINARAETVAGKPAFRDSFKRRRCLVPADGFYEWLAEDSGKQPYWFHSPGKQLFAFAGVWSSWKGDNQRVESFTILTRSASETVKPYHHRMPVILDERSWDDWLAGTPADAQAVLDAHEPSDLELHAVSRRMNSPSFNEPGCVMAVR